MRKMRPLIKSEYEPLVWDIFKDFDLVRIRTEPDGSCFFHAIAKAYFKPYITGKIKDKKLNRRKFIRLLRKDLSEELDSHYNYLSKGELKKIGEDLPEYSLENMKKELDSSAPVSNLYNEFISDQLKLDIYILDGIKRDVYMTGTDDDILYKNRKSIIILYLPGHYELVGVVDQDQTVETCFVSDAPIIRKIKLRMNELRSK